MSMIEDHPDEFGPHNPPTRRVSKKPVKPKIAHAEPLCKLCKGLGEIEVCNLMLSDPPQPVLRQSCPFCAGSGTFRGRIKTVVEAYLAAVMVDDRERMVETLKTFLHEGAMHRNISVEVWDELAPDIPCLLIREKE